MGRKEQLVADLKLPEYQENTGQLLSFITMLRACGSVLQGHSTVIVSTMESLLHQMR